MFPSSVHIAGDSFSPEPIHINEPDVLMIENGDDMPLGINKPVRLNGKSAPPIFWKPSNVSDPPINNWLLNTIGATISSGSASAVPKSKAL